MKTLVVAPDGALSFGDVPKPTCGEYQALLKNVACGICNGTDMKLIHREFKGFEAARDYPLSLGHEAVGIVEEVGAKVTGFKKGDVVLLPFTDPVPGMNSGWGGFSEYGVVNDVKALTADGKAPGCPEFPESAYAQSIVPADLDAVDAVMIVTFREVLSSIYTFGMGANKAIAVFGCGPVGLTFIKFLNLLGANPIIAFDVVDEKIQEAKKAGAHYAFNSTQVDVVKEVRAICPEGVDFALDAVGHLPLINQSMGIIRDRGRICCYGISPKQCMELDWSAADYNWDLCFQQMPRKDEEGACHNQIVAWIRAGVLDPKEFISDYAPFDDVIKMFEKVEQRQIAKKCIITF